jgi:lipid II:glycine glycyltransferase (peptidoglycan interpeptide bridge formation enzyme)
MQSWEWGEFRKKRQKISRVDNYLIVWTNVWRWRVGYVAMSQMPDESALRMILAEAKKYNAIFVRFEPIYGEINQNPPAGQAEPKAKSLRKGRALFKPKTLLWNLTKSEEELLAHMHSKTRYNIRVAQKHGVDVQEVTDLTLVEEHIRLLMDTAKRQHVGFHTPDYHRDLWASLSPNHMARLFVTTFQGEVLASAMIFCLHNVLYYAYGANSMKHKEVMASTVLLWRIAMWGKTNGYSLFDLWGSDAESGFSQFKERFGADSVELPGAFDYPCLPLLYPIFRFAEELRRTLRHQK